MKKIVFLFFLLIPLLNANAQRQMEHLDRGVVAINKGSGKLFISWRYFATDPENIGFNVYRQIGSATPAKLNSAPITNSTNYVWTVSGASLTVASKISVRPVINGVEGAEEGYWNMAATTRAHRIIHDFDFQKVYDANDKEVTMTMKYCWPGDLNGDGKYDFVVDRLASSSDDDDAESDDDIVMTTTTKIDAYNSDGTFLWRIDIGPNVITSSGHCDMVTTYDMDGDNCAEVLLAVSEGTTFPDGTVIKGDNGSVTDYTSIKGSAPQWVAIVNGKTGNLIDKVSLPHFDDIATERTDRWKHICGHFIIAYLDGIRPSLVYQYKNRQADGAFTGAYAAWHYAGGKLVQDWATRFLAPDGEFHQIRVGDVDGDGKDEVIEGGYAMDDDGTLLYYATGVGHGDRHCLADIDPDRPGLEHFFIQQSNILGMGLFDAATGEMIKALYMSSVTDVGRGICGAFDPTRRGMQFYSTLKNYAMYDCKGKLIDDAYGAYPAEALWWGPNLSRWSINPIGGNKNPAFHKYNTNTRRFDRDTPNFYQENNGNGAYYMLLGTGGRAAFWGDLLGDWREEMIMVRTNNTGFCVVSTWEETAIRQYCLMQNPAYRGQTTARGYYQTADVDFYMAADMPLPPVAPVQTADVYVTDANTLTASVANGKSVMFDIRNPNSAITVNDNISATKLWLMNPKGKDYTFNGTGKFTGSMELVKSLQGTVTLNGNHDYTGTTRISEGRLFVNGTLAGPMRIDARGVLGGNATINTITLEEGLNVEGGRLEPGNGSTLGTMTIAGNLSLPGRNNLAFDIDQTKTDKNDKLVVNGNFTVTNTNHTIVINPVTVPQTGTLTLATIAGTSNATADMFTVKGLEGTPYNLVVEANAIKIEIITSRAASNVEWNGSKSALWDLCRTENFLNAGSASYFAVNDMVTFNDNATTTNITIDETMPVDGLVFTNTKDYTISGDGVISGTGGLTKTGTGKVSLLTEENTFTGGIYFSNGVLEVASIKDGGLPSSVGASSSDANNWIMQNATLQTAAPMATDRNMTVYGTLTVNNPTTNTGILFSGEIKRGESNIELVLDGEGTTNLENSTQFSKVTIKDGILSLASLKALRSAFGSACTVVMEGGRINMLNVTTSQSDPNTSFSIEVPEGAEGTIRFPGRWTVKSALSGKGTLNVDIPYVRTDMNGNWSAFEGIINVTTGYSSGADFRVNNNNSYEKATFNLGDKVGVTHLTANRTIKIGALSGVEGSRLGGDNLTWTVGAKGESTTFNGVISGTATKFNKVGAGTLTLTNANTYTGATDVTAGTLYVANASGSATGTGAVTIRTGGKLSGNGIIGGNVTVYTDSQLDVFDGYNNQLTIGGNLTLSGGSRTRVDIFPGGTTAGISVGGAVKIAGTLVIPMNLTEFAEGKSYKIFETGAGKISGQFDDIESLLPVGLEWSQDRISEGIIYIKKATGLHIVDVIGKEVQSVEYFNLAGIRTDENTKGAIIRKTIYTDGYIATEIIFNK